MPKQMALVNYQACDPDQCDEGVCQAVIACPKRIFRQVAPYELPDPYPGICIGCGICVLACPTGAIQMM